NVAPSTTPPGGLQAAQIPQLLSFGFDDNNQSDAIEWILGMLQTKMNPHGKGAQDNPCTYDGTPVHATFYLSSVYVADMTRAGEDLATVKKSWHDELTNGSEMGDHTHSHSDGTAFTLDQWTGEIQMCLDWLTKPFDAAAVGTDMSKGIGVPRAEIIGFRTPFLAYNDNTF